MPWIGRCLVAPKAASWSCMWHPMHRGACARRYRAFSTFGNVQKTEERERNSPASVAESGRSALSKQVSEETDSLLNDVLLPLNDRHCGPLEGTRDGRTPLPFVFLLGNHSSGKSSFINYVLGRRVQNTGVAPTDDGFTVIVPGPEDMDQAGPSLVGAPDMGFGGLRSFGPNLIHSLQLKVRSGLAVKDIMVIDSPGMIDSPVDNLNYSHPNRSLRDSEESGGSVSLERQKRIDERGYDFQGVARWLAERADVILLFFDPDKPGTTGETLKVLTHSLTGLDHKLHIVLNKVDQFKKIHDFARAYGSVCWNLSKVISRKDLPRIYTIYTPVTLEDTSNKRRQETNDSENLDSYLKIGDDLSWSSALKDLEDTRKDVIAEVHRAPERRIDNMITYIYDSARLLRMHLIISEAARRDYHLARRRNTLNAVGIGVTGCLVSLASLYLVPSAWGFAAIISMSSIAGASGSYWYGNFRLTESIDRMRSIGFLDELFSRVYIKEVADGDQFVYALWKRVRPQVIRAIETVGPNNMNRVAADELDQLNDIIDVQVPKLRRVTQPEIEKRNW